MEFGKYNNLPANTDSRVNHDARQLHQILTMLNNQTHADLARYNIHDLPPFLTFDTAQRTLETSLSHNISHQDAPSHKPSKDFVNTDISQSFSEKRNTLRTFAITSQQELIGEMHNYYMTNAYDVTTKALGHKKLPSQHIPQMAEKIITEIALKKIDTFFNQQKKLLIDHAFMITDAEKYSSWRFQTITEPITFTLERDSAGEHTLSAANYITDSTITAFRESLSTKDTLNAEHPVNTPLSEENRSFYTSEHINKQLDELQNL